MKNNVNSLKHVSELIPQMICQMRNRMYIFWKTLYDKHKGNLQAISKDSGYELQNVKETLISLGII